MVLLILILLVGCVYYLEKKIYGTVYTPCIMLGIPFLMICLLYDQYSNDLGYYPLNYNVLYIWIFGLVLFFSVGLVTTLVLEKGGIKNKQILASEIAHKSLIQFNKGLINIIFVCALLSIFVLKQAYSIFITAGPDEVEKYLSGGIQGHLVVSLKFFSITSFISLFMPISRISRFKNVFIVIIALSLCLLYGTKSGVLILIVTYYLAWAIYFNKKIKIVHIVLAVALGFGIFFLSYSVLFGKWAPLDFIWQHMVKYYVAGTASMSVYFSNYNPAGIEPEMLFRPFYNIIFLLTGNSQNIKDVISNEWTVIGTGPGTVVNVKTFFGTIYLYGGIKGGILAIVIFSFLSYFCLHLVQKGVKNVLIICLYVYILSTFCFGWFDFYLNTLALIEYVAFTFLFGLLIVRK